jgi:hypothetical protein
MNYYALVKKKFVLCITSLLFLLGCHDDHSAPGEGQSHGHLKQTKTFSSDVAIQWMDMQIKLMKQTTTVGNVAFSRHYAYSGIALYESVVPGMPAHRSLAFQLNGLGQLPKASPVYPYHWAASANAALAYMNKNMFPNTSDENKAAIDALEARLHEQYSKEVDSPTLVRSVAFGKAIATKILEWSETDGYKHVNDPYTPPCIGEQYWTPPNPMPVHTLPYWGNVRPLVVGSGDGAQPEAPNYAQLPEMTMEVINAKPLPSDDNYQIAFWWRDFPGTSTPGHYISILKQVLQKKKPGLDEAAFAYALGGVIVMDISISTWQAKFKHLLARPFAYSAVIGKAFTSLLGAPHPEYPAAHASMSIANAEAMTIVFGNNYAFTDSTFVGLTTPQGVTLAPRSYDSFREAGEEAGYSRMYGGIHYRKSIEIGFWQGKKVASNIVSKLKFRR